MRAASLSWYNGKKHSVNGISYYGFHLLNLFGVSFGCNVAEHAGHSLGAGGHQRWNVNYFLGFEVDCKWQMPNNSDLNREAKSGLMKGLCSGRDLGSFFSYFPISKAYLCPEVSVAPPMSSFSPTRLTNEVYHQSFPHHFCRVLVSAVTWPH